MTMKTSERPFAKGDWLIVLDGRKFLAFRNDGTADRPALTRISEATAETGPARALGTDRPGRVQPSVGSAASAVEQTDFHEAAERSFVEDAVAALAILVRDGQVQRAVVAAPARALAAFRAAVPKAVRAVVVEEIVADLTKEPVDALERRLARAG
jgi:protein required for attachment to host cells